MTSDKQEMDVYSGVRWSAVAKYGTQAVEFVIAVVLVRILAPEDYGLLAMALVFTGFLKVFRSFGFGLAIVQRKQINEELLSSLFYVNLLVGCLLAAILVAGAPLFSWLFNDARVGRIVTVLSIIFVIAAPALVPSSLLTRRMAFHRLAIVEGIVTIVKGTTAICLALSGWEVWALVWATISGSAMRTALIYSLCAWRPRPVFRWSEVRSVLSFATNLTGVQVFNYFIVKSDSFIVGVFLGPIPLGFYSVASRFLRYPQEAITQVIARVLLPAFSRMQDDDARLASAYLRVCGAIAFAAFPALLGLLVVARPFVEVVLGTKWLPALPLLCVFVPLAMLQCVGSTAGHLFVAKARTGLLFRWSIVAGTVRVCGLLVGIRWGVLGVAVSYTLTACALSIPYLWISCKLVDGLRLRDLFNVLARYATYSGTMALLVLGCRVALEQIGVNPTVVLAACVGLGVITYTTIILFTRPPAFADFCGLLPDGWAPATRHVAANRVA